LKYSCRNRVDTQYGDFNYDKTGVFAIGRSYVGSGTVADIWDTIDDSNNFIDGLPVSIVAEWGPTTDCGGLELATNDSAVWRDSTPGGCSSGKECVMFDKISKLEWSAKAATQKAWDDAWSHCLNLTWDGKTGWRLPTQKEIWEAYIHGIRDATNSNWINKSTMDFSGFWSGTSVSGDGGNAFKIIFGQSYPSVGSKSSLGEVVCVR
jgi:hypothetical protein